ncbi:glycoside hydrolase family 43 protein [Paenibacillus sp. SYP-B4298]|uniref:glycoside hydrolase family 43 protein n=1 Tax=Paenibacillus sp. SYP-B4298 TaxID=2996034 RepID=UPI0022DE6C11|nr:glycoside hydrolase family 43 protein [Paenibacillus sp. SYP-B4298]
MAKQTITYTNPILPGFYPDPSIVRAEDAYYLINSSFEYFPGVPIFRSYDLLHWEQIGHVLDRISQLDVRDRLSSDGIFAPTIRYHAGTFYMITTDVRGIGNFYVTATDPAGPWSDPILVPHGGIDPSLFFDDDGKVYVTAQQGEGYNSHAIQYEIDIQTGKALSEPVVVWHGDGGPWTEGPHLYKVNGMYYMMSASGGTAKEHREIIGRSSHPYGPFEMFPEPILTHRDMDHPIQYLGHADLVEDTDGQWWAVFLGVRLVETGYSVLGRETFLAPVQWRDGWPHIDNNEGVVSLKMQVELPAGNRPTRSKPAACEGRETFAGTELKPEWMFLRNPAEGSWSLTDHPGSLTLYGQPGGLHDVAQVSFIGRRQQHVHAEYTTCMSFAPASEQAEAGLVARRDEDAYYAIGVKRVDGGLAVYARLRYRGKSQTEHLVPIEGEDFTGNVWLRIEADVAEYSLYYSLDGEKWKRLAGASARSLSPEDFVDKMCFTGTVMGLYASGNGKHCAEPARFAWFETRLPEGQEG